MIYYNNLTKGFVMKLLVVILSLFAPPILADSVMLSHVQTDYKYSNGFANSIGGSVTGYDLGYSFNINPKWSIDLNYSELGLASRTRNGIGGTFEADTASLMAYYRNKLVTIAGMPLKAHIKAHIKAGITHAKAEVIVNSINRSDTDVGLKFGAGLSLWVLPT